jgi:hypothetical protein
MYQTHYFQFSLSHLSVPPLSLCQDDIWVSNESLRCECLCYTEIKKESIKGLMRAWWINLYHFYTLDTSLSTPSSWGLQHKPYLCTYVCMVELLYLSYSPCRSNTAYQYRPYSLILGCRSYLSRISPKHHTNCSQSYTVKLTLGEFYQTRLVSSTKHYKSQLQHCRLLNYRIRYSLIKYVVFFLSQINQFTCICV